MQHLKFSSCWDFACQSTPLLFAFKRGNPEFGNSLGNAQPGWSQLMGSEQGKLVGPTHDGSCLSQGAQVKWFLIRQLAGQPGGCSPGEKT